MTDTMRRRPTGGDTVAPPPDLQVSKTRTIEDLAREAHDVTEKAGHLRNVTATVESTLIDVHHRGFRVQLATHTSKAVKRAITDLLSELNELGLGWRDIARMVGVSVPALRRWRQGESPTGDHRRRVAEVVAFLSILTQDHLVSDVASWMEVPITHDVAVTPIDLYSKGQLATIFDLASEHITPEQALDRDDPGWRERIDTKYEVFRAADGQPAIRPRSPSGR
jgi:transcriptional regulator with XRE-family HTH domain